MNHHRKKKKNIKTHHQSRHLLDAHHIAATMSFGSPGDHRSIAQHGREGALGGLDLLLGPEKNGGFDGVIGGFIWLKMWKYVEKH